MGFSIDAAFGLIDADASGQPLVDRRSGQRIYILYKAEKEIIRIIAALNGVPPRGRSGLSLVVWTLKREVRAFGECLGMYRR